VSALLLAAAHGLGLGFPAAASPGPFQAVLLQRAGAVGPRRALPLALVPLVSDPVVIVATSLALAGLPGGFIRLLQAAGGALLAWMGATGVRDLVRPRLVEDQAAAAPARGFWRAALVNLTNPNAWIFWSLVGSPILAEALRTAPAAAALFLGGFYAALTGTNAALVLLFGAVGRLGPGVARTLAGVSAAAFLVLGLTQLWRAALG
jgi:threonine/homoserine/homoserine lactone efflux protein